MNGLKEFLQELVNDESGGALPLGKQGYEKAQHLLTQLETQKLSDKAKAELKDALHCGRVSVNTLREIFDLETT